MTGRTSRTKGAAWEREVARRLRAIYPGARRGAQSRSGRDCADVEGLPWHLEAKCGRSVSARAALDQAERDTDGRPVLVAIHDDAPRPGARAREWVAMPWAVFEALARAAALDPAPPVEGRCSLCPRPVSVTLGPVGYCHEHAPSRREEVTP